MYYDGEKMGGAGNIIQDLGDRMNKSLSCKLVSDLCL